MIHSHIISHLRRSHGQHAGSVTHTYIKYTVASYGMTCTQSSTKIYQLVQKLLGRQVHEKDVLLCKKGEVKSYMFLKFTRFQVLLLVITKGLTLQSSRMVLTMYPLPPSSRCKSKGPKVAADRKFLQNAGNILSDYTASPHPRRQ